MSIINDALKKAELDQKLSPPKHLQSILSPAMLKTGAQRGRLRRWLAGGAVLLLCFAVFILATNYFKQPLEIKLAQPMPSSDVQHPLEAPTPSSSKTLTAPIQMHNTKIKTAVNTANFQLSGILYDQQKSLAIINQHIVAEGSFVNEAQLLTIQPNYVQLLLKGEKITLEIK